MIMLVLDVCLLSNQTQRSQNMIEGGPELWIRMRLRNHQRLNHSTPDKTKTKLLPGCRILCTSVGPSPKPALKASDNKFRSETEKQKQEKRLSRKKNRDWLPITCRSALHQIPNSLYFVKPPVPRKSAEGHFRGRKEDDNGDFLIN